MQPSPPRTLSGVPALVRLLACLGDAEVHASTQPLADRLSQWLGWTDAVTLSSVLGAPAPAAAAGGARTPDGDAAALRCQALRAALVKAITADTASGGPATAARRGPAPALGAARANNLPPAAPAADADFAVYRQRYLALQQKMDSEIGDLRAFLRGRLAASSPTLARLAVLDATMERSLAARERSLLGTVPGRLAAYFERLRRDALAAQAAAASGPADGNGPAAAALHAAAADGGGVSASPAAGNATTSGGTPASAAAMAGTAVATGSASAAAANAITSGGTPASAAAMAGTAVVAGNGNASAATANAITSGDTPASAAAMAGTAVVAGNGDTPAAAANAITSDGTPASAAAMASAAAATGGGNGNASASSTSPASPAAALAAAARPAAAQAPQAWLDTFRNDLRSVLLAELEVRFQPVEGLLAALRAR